MDMAIVTGKLWATRKDPTLAGTQFVIIQPIDENRQPMGEPLVANDITNQIGTGETVFFVTGGDAALLEEGQLRPIDAAVVGIVDSWSTELDVPYRERKRSVSS